MIPQDNWDNFDQYNARVITPLRTEARAKMASIKDRKRKRALPFFALSLVLLGLWGITVKTDLNIIPLMSGDNILYYWFGIIIFAAVGTILLFWGSEKQKIKSFLLEQIVAFRGWESAFRPDQFDLIYDLKKEKTPIAQLLKAKVGYKPRIGENLTGCLTHNRYQVTLPHCQITEMTCSAQYCEDNDEDGRSMATQFFNGLLITGDMGQASGGSLAIYPQADVQFPGQETVEDLSNYLDMAEQILPDPYPENFILYSPNDTALPSKILAIVDELSKTTFPIRQSYIWISGNKYILALDFDQYFFEGDLLNSDEDILKLKNLLAALEITSNKLFKLT
ncbi:MAG: hypothetical protein GXP00_07450 [Alphaproteobacteria bacterium]|nr:hypothetical protein [Alphaproteobacteria bacterium]